jgi:CRISPR/Cas system-associated exonuclease Cas4 (RecB family)
MSNDNYITASEIAEYIYCNRAWWLKLTGYKSENQAALTQGSESHSQYARQVNTVTRLEKIGRLILVLGIVLLIVFVLVRLFLR